MPGETIYVIIALFALGVVLLVMGVRGRRIGDHPHCRKCGFDLHGLDGASVRCPECGADRTAKRAVRIGLRRRRPIVTVLGATLLLVSLAGTGALFWGQATQFNWNTIKPAWLLVYEVRGSDSAAVDEVLDELISRLNAGTLQERWQVELVPRALEVQHDTEGPWSESWGELIGQLMLAGAMSEEQLLAHVQSAITTSFAVRPVVRSGSEASFEIQVHSERLAWSGILALYSGPEFIRVGEREVAAGGYGLTDMIYPRSGFHAGFSTRTHLDLVPGHYPVVAQWTLAIIDEREGQGLEAAIVRWTVEHEAEIEIVGPDGDEVRKVANAELNQRITRLVYAYEPRVRAFGGGLRPGGMVAFKQLPIDVAFEVYWRVGEREWLIGEVSQRGQWGRSGMNYFASHDIPELEDVERVTVILRASESVARKTTTMVEIWDGELVFEDQRILRDGEQRSVEEQEAYFRWSMEDEELAD